MNRTDIDTVTYDVTNRSKVTAIAMATGKQAYTCTGVKKLFNAGSTLVTVENRPNKYTHTFHLEQFEIDAASLENLTDMEDVVVIVELKDKGTAGDGEFVVLGLQNGLYKTADDWSANDNNGVRTVDLASMAGHEEKEERYILDAGDRATAQRGEEGLIASDLVDQLPASLLELADPGEPTPW